MWIMTPFGILMPSQRPTATMVGDARSLQIRARDKQALQFLKRHYMPTTLGKIIHTPDFDYEYRAYCTKADFAEAMDRMIGEIDYEKFKPQTEVALGKIDGGKLHTLYNRIWSVVAQHYDSSVLRRYEPKKTPAKGYAWDKVNKKGRH